MDAGGGQLVHGGHQERKCSASGRRSAVGAGRQTAPAGESAIDKPQPRQAYSQALTEGAAAATIMNLALIRDVFLDNLLPILLTAGA
jgi:hypothetical protein